MALKDRKLVVLEKTADVATKWIGSTGSLLVHTAIFVASFALSFLGIVHFETMLLVLTTLVSLEAIYLSIFIQMTINKNSQVIEIIQEDVGEIQEDVGEIQEDVGEIQEGLEEIEEDIDEIQKDVDEINDGSNTEQVVEKKEAEALANIQAILLTLQKEIEALKRK